LRIPLVQALTLTLLVLATTGSAADATAGDLEAADDSIRMLRSQGMYAEAARVAEELLVRAVRDSLADSFEIEELQQQVSYLKYAAELPEAITRELALAESLLIEADAAWAEGRYSDGVTAEEHRLEILSTHLGPDHFEVAECLMSLAANLREIGSYEASESRYEEALDLLRLRLREDHPRIADCVNELGIVLDCQGLHEEACTVLRSALNMRRRALGESHPSVAHSMSNVASALEGQGYFAAAEPLYRRALAIYRRSFDESSFYVAVGLSNLSYVLGMQGNYLEAAPMQEEALRRFQDLRGEEHPHVANAHNNMGHVLHEMGRYEEAEQHHRRALAIRRKLLGNRNPATAVSLNNLASTLKALGQYAEAEGLYRESLEVIRSAFGTDHPFTAHTLNNMASLAAVSGECAEAESLCLEAAAVYQRQEVPQPGHLVTTLRRLGETQLCLRRYEDAEETLAKAADLYEEARKRMALGLARATFLRSPYDVLSATELALGHRDAAWQSAEKTTAASLADLLMSGGPSVVSSREAARRDSMTGLITNLEGRIAACIANTEADGVDQTIEGLRSLQSSLLIAESERSALDWETAEQHPGAMGRIRSLERVQSGLDAGSAIVGWLDVEFETGGSAAWVYVIRETGSVEWAELHAGTAADREERGVSDGLDALREALATPEAPLALVRHLARSAWRDRLGVVQSGLGGVSDLIVVPSGRMLGIPLEVFITESGGLAGESYTVSYVPSAAIRVWLAENGSGGHDGKMLLVGDPPFDAVGPGSAGTEGTPVAVATYTQGNESVRSLLAGSRDMIRGLPRLRGARAEIAALADLCDDPVVLVGEQASEQELAKLAASGELLGFRGIHFATHAFVDDRDHERSALVLSQVGLPDPLESVAAGTRIYDGLASAGEVIREWDLDAELVTLSACETGLGRDVQGEGYVGFAHAFLQAGARSMLVSLWRVDDRATSLLMRRFYGNWLGKRGETDAPELERPMSKADALQEAKQWLREYEDEYGNHPYEHPYYWSAFILIGDAS